MKWDVLSFRERSLFYCFSAADDNERRNCSDTNDATFFMRQCSSTHCCVPYGCEYVYGAESSQRIHRLQRSAKSLVEYVTNSGSAAPEK